MFPLQTHTREISRNSVFLCKVEYFELFSVVTCFVSVTQFHISSLMNKSCTFCREGHTAPSSILFLAIEQALDQEWWPAVYHDGTAAFEVTGSSVQGGLLPPPPQKHRVSMVFLFSKASRMERGQCRALPALTQPLHLTVCGWMLSVNWYKPFSFVAITQKYKKKKKANT